MKSRHEKKRNTKGDERKGTKKGPKDREEKGIETRETEKGRKQKRQGERRKEKRNIWATLTLERKKKVNELINEKKNNKKM